MKTITFNNGKPQTEVDGECNGFRMRQPWELVHYRENESDTQCSACGGFADVWFGSMDRYSNHPMRCT